MRPDPPGRGAPLRGTPGQPALLEVVVAPPAEGNPEDRPVEVLEFDPESGTFVYLLTRVKKPGNPGLLAGATTRMR